MSLTTINPGPEQLGLEVTVEPLVTDALQTVSLRGVEIAKVTSQQTIDHLVQSSLQGEGGVLLTANLDVMRLISHSSEVAELVAGADIRVADGTPVVWLSRMQGTPLPERVAGSDLTVTLSGALAEAGKSIYLLGGDPGIATQAALRLREMYPDIRIAGTHCPPFGFAQDPDEVAATVARVVDAKPDFVYIGLPFVMAATLARQISAALPSAWVMGVGVSFSFVTGDVRRAPVWMQRSGLEWLHRLTQEPTRLFRRYILEDLPFLARAAPVALGRRFLRRARLAPGIRVHHFGPVIGEVGGMASVIQTLGSRHVGADETHIHPTWSAQSRVRTVRYTLGSAAVIARLPRSTVVHLHLSEGGSFVREGALVILARARRLPTVVTLHGARFDDALDRYPWLIRRVLSAAGAVTCLDRRHIPRVEDLSHNPRVSYVPNPVEIRSDASGAELTEPRVLFAGEVGIRKGADVLAEAWPAVKAAVPDATCILVGPGTELELEPQDGLEVRPPAPSVEIAELMQSCRCVALPSRAEALPMILLEAMACGRPFVSTPVGGIASLGDGGILVPVGDAPALAQALIGLLSDPEAARTLGQSGKRQCMAEQSISVVDERLRNLYGELIGAGR